VRKAQLDVDPLLPEPLQFLKILHDGRPMAGVDDLVSFAEHKDSLAAHRYGWSEPGCRLSQTSRANEVLRGQAEPS
jgi:hypothetical protein